MQKSVLENKYLELYKFIKDFIEDNSIPPTIRQICAHMGYKSTATAHLYVKALVKKGLISYVPGAQRSISLCSEKRGAADKIALLPNIGTVAAGMPIYAFDDMSMYDTVALPSSLIHGADETDAFILNVKGESMIEAGINNGDMIVVHSGVHCENGDIVVARISGDTATVKRLFYEKDRIRLQPENSSMEPIYASYEDTEIIGKVVTLLRRY